MLREVKPELLDELPPEDPRAERARRDLRRINAWMGNFRLMESLLARVPRAPARIVELGGGDGALALEMARRMNGRWKGVEWSIIDRAPAVRPETVRQAGSHGWTLRVVKADVFEWLGRDVCADAVLANLFLHHFQNTALRDLLSLAATRCDAFAACEPRRSRMSLTGSRMVGLIGCGPVARHDAVVSVRAGFNGEELSELWPSGGLWRVTEEAGGYASHCFLALRARMKKVEGRR